jgi:amino acid transporter
MLPAGLGAVQRRLETPVVAIWLTGALVALLAVTGTFAQLILLNVAARLYQYLLVCIAVAALRFRAPDRARPFRLPLGIAIPVLAAALCLLLLARQPLANLLATAAALAAGLALYLLTRRLSR